MQLFSAPSAQVFGNWVWFNATSKGAQGSNTRRRTAIGWPPTNSLINNQHETFGHFGPLRFPWDSH